VQEVVAGLRNLGATTVEEWELTTEDVNFGLPPELVQLVPSSSAASTAA
jgi:hypothetical protein